MDSDRSELIDRLAECADWLGGLSNCKASDDCLAAARAALKRATGDAYYMPKEVSEEMEVNLPALQFMARLVDAVVQLRREVDRTYTELKWGGWEGYDYAAKFDQLLAEADAFGEEE